MVGSSLIEDQPTFMTGGQIGFLSLACQSNETAPYATGKLARHITLEQSDQGDTVATGIVIGGGSGPDDPSSYAMYREMGTRHQKPKPWMQAAYRKMQHRIMKMWEG